MTDTPATQPEPSSTLALRLARMENPSEIDESLAALYTERDGYRLKCDGLKAIVDKLPLTADGARVVLQQHLFLLESAQEIVVVNMGICDGLYYVMQVCDDRLHYLDSCYSTEVAARAAGTK